MNNWVAKLVGATIGAGIGYFVGSVVVEVIHMREDLSDVDYDDLEYPHEEDETNLEMKEPGLIMGQKRNQTKQTRIKNYTEYFNKQGKPELAALVAKYNNNELLEDVAVQDTVPVPDFDPDEVDPDIPTDPSIISVDEYVNASGYEVVTLKYYEDDVVTDEYDNPIDRPESFLGDDALISFGELSGDEDIVYVRNEAKHAMYEVVRTNKEYSVPVAKRHRAVKKEEDNAEEDIT